MGRALRHAAGGVVYHALNRANARLKIFDDDGDYAAFEKVLAQAIERTRMRLLAYCLMPNHFHLMLWPRGATDLSQFMRWLTLTHTQRWHAHRGSAGEGHLYQGRFKSFPVQEDRHFLIAARYVERNALRAELVKRAEAWRWSSLWLRRNGPPPTKEHAGAGKAQERVPPLVLSEWPVGLPRDWLSWVNRPQTAVEEAAFRLSLSRGRPLGNAAWQHRIAKRLGLEMTLRPHGRPRKHQQDAAIGCRGRDGGCPPPPAQIPANGTTAPGSCLG